MHHDQWVEYIYLPRKVRVDNFPTFVRSLMFPICMTVSLKIVIYYFVISCKWQNCDKGPWLNIDPGRAFLTSVQVRWPWHQLCGSLGQWLRMNDQSSLPVMSRDRTTRDPMQPHQKVNIHLQLVYINPARILKLDLSFLPFRLPSEASLFTILSAFTVIWTFFPWKMLSVDCEFLFLYLQGYTRQAEWYRSCRDDVRQMVTVTNCYHLRKHYLMECKYG